MLISNPVAEVGFLMSNIKAVPKTHPKHSHSEEMGENNEAVLEAPIGSQGFRFLPGRNGSKKPPRAAQHTAPD